MLSQLKEGVEGMVRGITGEGELAGVGQEETEESGIAEQEDLIQPV